MFDETFRQLEQLLQAEAARKEGILSLLRSAVRGLDGGLIPADEPPGQGDEVARRRGVTAPAERFVPLPVRTTPGGRWGPAVAAKLRAEALRR